MQTCSVTIVNALGLHARAAARFVHHASQFESQIKVTRGARTVDGKSILGLLLLAAPRGATLDVSATGADEGAAIKDLSALIIRGFDETGTDGG
ncbi:MAG: HPr family phosphocarrier protein [Acidobacteria bacterium]|nr:HPr family phosphocarrier protein [Acidobacteriota bacterium]